MPTLLVSLGMSWPVVPEAFHCLPPGPSGFSKVHVLTSSSIGITPGVLKIIEFFQSHHPDVELRISRVDGFDDLRTQDDHFEFEEVMFRWILDSEPDAAQRYVCLAGGFKTISAAMQKAAGVLGAAEIFHVLVEGKIETPDAIEKALANFQVRFIKLGHEPGWPQLRTLTANDFPLVTVTAEGCQRWVRANDCAFRSHLAELLERSRRIMGAWDRLAELPFTELAAWSQSQLAWLNAPLEPNAPSDRAWVAALPKVELHCHLGGFATHEPLLHTVRNAAENPKGLPPLLDCTPPDGWPLPSSPIGLDRYTHLGDNNGRKLLRDLGCLRTQCSLLYHELLAQNVRYAEIRCSPNNYAVSGRDQSALTVLMCIRGQFQMLMEEAAAARKADSTAPFPCHVNLIVIATRKNSGDRSDISRHLSLAITAADQWVGENCCRVVGVDLAGFENKDTRAAFFETDFEAIHRVGLAVTVHAGENDDAEGIWQAVFKLNARRLGHALHLWQSPDLLRAVADRRIGVEMCPYANLQIKGYPLDAAAGTALPGTVYPLSNYMKAGVSVTINTDNPGISAASLSDNLLLAARLNPGLTRLDLLRLLRNCIDQAFVPPSLRIRLLRDFPIPHP